ncbi:TetR/AcrR family transcriptional regulator [Sphingobium fluviale]|uniref:TetR/AcrR family transcriptional regulator n=1 Tax=Sphingobium fluviale TaxID=2506423 RepID=A0A4Q1KFT9_9SPHN|nr:TetR/AcrR family transcriptional regulator [Sphingobium fluviale]RXR28531.1 TetR/AcrR family transcriptional regulator [Sphingobium fluviale]
MGIKAKRQDQMSFPKASKEKVDHRTIVAQKKRTAMRQRILDATMKVCSIQENSLPKIDDIIETARISKGGFYRYFESASDALEQLGKQTADEFSQAILPVYNVLDDPVKRACVGTMLILRRAARDPEWAGYLLRANLTDHESKLLKFIEQDMEQGIRTGQFAIADVQAASEFVMGINHTAIRVILSRKITQMDAYIDTTVAFLLHAMGTRQDAIKDVLAWSVEYFRSIDADGKW